MSAYTEPQKRIGALMKESASVQDNVGRSLALVDNRPRSIAQMRLKETSPNSKAGLFDNRPDTKTIQRKDIIIQQPPLRAIAVNGVIQRVTVRAQYGKSVDEMGRQELNMVIDDERIDDDERLIAEGELRNINNIKITQISALVANENYNAALNVAKMLAGLSGDKFIVRATTDYSLVIPKGTPLPGGGIPSGVTVPTGNGGSIIYIHIVNIKKWILNNDIGDLISTIAHEATHVQQNKNGGPGTTDEREFEAYSIEIFSALRYAINGEIQLFPSSAHISQSYESAMTHYENLDAAARLDHSVRYSSLQTEYLRLLPILKHNDLESGRVNRIALRIVSSLERYLAAGEKDQVAYPAHAYNEFTKIPDRYREPYGVRINTLIDKARLKSLKKYQASGMESDRKDQKADSPASNHSGSAATGSGSAAAGSGGSGGKKPGKQLLRYKGVQL